MRRKSAVKAMLVKHEIKQTEIARELDISRGAVSQVLNGQATSRRIQEHIAQRLGKPYDKVWGKIA